jgi:hypothetical protein
MVTVKSSHQMFYVSYHDLTVSQWPWIFCTCPKHFLVLSSFMNYHWVCNLSKVNTMGVTIGAGTAYSSGISEFIPRFLVRFVLLLCNKVCQTCDRSVVFSGYSGFLHDTTEILLKVALNTINQPTSLQKFSCFQLVLQFPPPIIIAILNVYLLFYSRMLFVISGGTV